MTFFIVIVEILIFCYGATLFAYSPTRKISESLSIGIFLSFVLLSLIFQVAFLLEKPSFSVVFEIVVLLRIIKYIIDRKSLSQLIIKSISQFVLDHKIVTVSIIVCWLYLFLLVTIIPPSNWDSMAYNLSRIFLFQQENSLLLENVTTLRQNMFVVGADILNYGFLRLNKDYGVGVFSWLAYVSIGLGTYGLSRTFADTKVSIAATLIIISLPELCFQATSTKNDIFTAASAVFCFIISDRLLKEPSVKNIALLLLGIAYGFSAKSTFLGFLAPFGVGLLAIFIIKIGWKKLFQIIIQDWLYFIILTAPILILSQFWLFLNNIVTTSDATGGETIKIVRSGNITGGIANLIRYFFQSIDFFPFSYIAKGRLGFNVGEYLTDIYRQIFEPIFSGSGMGYINNKPYPFEIKIIPSEDFSWFGPFAISIVLPAILFSLLKGNYWLKAQSVSLLGFIGIVSFKLVWTPWNNRYLTLFFAASGVCVAFFLQQISQKYRPKILKIITTTALIILVSACVLNTAKPLGGLSITEFFKPNIWSKTDFGSDRLYYARKHHKDNRVEQFRDLVAPNSKVALIAGQKSWIYHFYLVRGDLDIIPTSFTEFIDNDRDYDYLFCLDVECDPELSTVNYHVLWSSSTESPRPSKLIQLKN